MKIVVIKHNGTAQNGAERNDIKCIEFYSSPFYFVLFRFAWNETEIYQRKKKIPNMKSKQNRTKVYEKIYTERV